MGSASGGGGVSISSKMFRKVSQDPNISAGLEKKEREERERVPESERASCMGLRNGLQNNRYVSGTLERKPQASTRWDYWAGSSTYNVLSHLLTVLEDTCFPRACGMHSARAPAFPTSFCRLEMTPGMMQR